MKLNEIQVQPSILSGTPPGQLLNEPLLCERDGWALFTSTVQAKDLFRECNVLLHKPCDRIFPNWWVVPEKDGKGGLKDPMIECVECNCSLPVDAYEFFWQAYRLMNLKQGAKLD